MATPRRLHVHEGLPTPVGSVTPAAAALVAQAMTEDDLLTNVLDTAAACRWLAHHSRPAVDRSGRWATHLQGNRGLPDLILARRGHVVAAELKRMGGKPTAAQRHWLAAMAGVAEWPWDDGHTVLNGAVTVALWTPAEWASGLIERTLR